MFGRTQPAHKPHQIRFSQRRATGRWPIHSTTNVKKDCTAIAGHWRVGIVSNFDQPAISKIAASHFFVAIIIRRIPRVDHDMPIVIRRTRIVAPDIGFGHLMKWIVCSRWQRGIIGKNFADSENACGRSTISLMFSQARFILTNDPTPPGQPIFPEQGRNWSSIGAPLATDLIQETQTPMHGIPIGRKGDNELGTTIRERGGISVARD